MEGEIYLRLGNIIVALEKFVLRVAGDLLLLMQFLREIAKLLVDSVDLSGERVD